MRILFFGDVVGKSGRQAIQKYLKKLRDELSADVVVVNGENSAGGLGINRKSIEELLDAGANVITTGNHAFHWKEWKEVFDNYPMVLFPANYPGLLERSHYTTSSGLTVMNIQGRVFMECIDNPFLAANRLLEVVPKDTFKLLDFHAEATSEKLAMGYYLDGRVHAVVGTHTHIQTADERLLPNGTLYITDVGMTGPYDDSILGMHKDAVISKFLNNRPARYEVASGRCTVNAVLIEINKENRDIKRLSFIE